MNNTNTPYAHLNPDRIQDAIESLGFHCTGSLLALNSYENRVYQVGIEGAAPLIAKFYRPKRWSNAAILEEHQFSIELAARDIPVIPPLEMASGNTLHEYQGFHFALFMRQGGRAFELDNPEHLEWIGRFIGRLHAVGACQSFQHRLRLDVQSYGYLPYQFLLEHDFIPAELKLNFCRIIDEVLQKMQHNFETAQSIRYIRLHGDCHAGNILWNNSGPHIVDLDDCLMGPAIQDIWMLLSGNMEPNINASLEQIMRGYQEFHDFNFCERYLIESLRTLRMIHYAAWLAKRWEDPAFPLNFPWFNTPRYWADLMTDLREQSFKLDENN